MSGFGLLRLGEVEQFASAFLAFSEFCHPNLRVLLLKKIQRIELFDGFEFSLDFIQGNHATPLLKPLSPTTRTERFPLHSCSGFVTGVLKWDVVCEGDNSVFCPFIHAGPRARQPQSGTMTHPEA